MTTGGAACLQLRTATAHGSAPPRARRCRPRLARAQGFFFFFYAPLPSGFFWPTSSARASERARGLETPPSLRTHTVAPPPPQQQPLVNIRVKGRFVVSRTALVRPVTAAGRANNEKKNNVPGDREDFSIDIIIIIIKVYRNQISKTIRIFFFLQYQ